MPVLASSAYTTVENILNLARVILNDSAVPGGDILTDQYPNLFSLVNGGYEAVQKALAVVGVETLSTYDWLIGLPVISGTVDPEARLIVGDTGWNIIYPGGVGNSSGATPQLFQDLVVPLKLWERQTGTNNYPTEMIQPNDGIRAFAQQTYLIDWEWGCFQTGGLDSLMFRGALQSQDVKVKYERHLPKLAAVTDPVPIRGVDNAAAYAIAEIFSAGRGGSIADGLAKKGQDEIFRLQEISARRTQRIRSRRQPYSGRRTWGGWRPL